MSDTPLDAMRLEMARNAAENGRLLCVLLALINFGAGHHALAIASAIPIGMAAIVDRIPNHLRRLIAAQLVIVFAAAASVTSLLATLR